ncbi:MAG TPA: hypothetical protein VFE07_11110 [Marmoricola sp.]|nr:hypothetical protein [Marmoricola sp.]
MFIQVMQAKCSRADEVRAFMDRWTDDDSVGFLGGTFGVTDEGEFLGIVRFESADAASANSARPETDALSKEFAELLDGPVSFSDYDDVTDFLGGGSDDAGFVQVIRGHVDDVDAAKAFSRDPGDIQQMRPEIIGGTFAVTADGDYTQTIYFTDEASARQGEQQEPPAEVRERLEDMMAGASYYDLRNPWFETA